MRPLAWGIALALATPLCADPAPPEAAPDVARLEVGVFEGHLFDLLFIADLEGAPEPGASFFEAMHLAGVAGEIVWDGGFAWELAVGRQQCVPGCLQSVIAGAAQGIRLVQPAGRAIRGELH